jgi:hypothetical protein
MANRNHKQNKEANPGIKESRRKSDQDLKFPIYKQLLQLNKVAQVVECLGYTGTPCLRANKQKSENCQKKSAYHPNYSGGRDQEDCGLKPAQENSS